MIAGVVWMKLKSIGWSSAYWIRNCINHGILRQTFLTGSNRSGPTAPIHQLMISGTARNRLRDGKKLAFDLSQLYGQACKAIAVEFVTHCVLVCLNYLKDTTNSLLKQKMRTNAQKNGLSLSVLVEEQRDLRSPGSGLQNVASLFVEWIAGQKALTHYELG